MKIILVIGTRPEAIKMVPVYQALQACDWCVPKILLTGQHAEMASNVLSLFGIQAHFDLKALDKNQTLATLAARVTNELAEVLSRERPDAILVQGDTTSAMIAAWLGFYLGSRVGHIEAGLRTGNMLSPFPEEFNRRVLSLAASLHFAPTEGAAENLKSEGIVKNVHVVGNTVIDAAYEMARKETDGARSMASRLPFLNNSARRTVLVTAHRRENFGSRMDGIAEAIGELATLFSDVDFVFPMHPNPSVAKSMLPVLSNRENVHLIRPLEYDEMIHLLRQSFMVMTDSGGIQEEAPAFGVPVLVLRDETERPEGVHAGCSALVGTDPAKIVEAASRMMLDPEAHSRMANVRNPYGDGTASIQIAEILRNTC